MSRHGLDTARQELKRKLQERRIVRPAERMPERPAQYPDPATSPAGTCGSCNHRGDEVVGPSSHKPLGYYHCKLRLPCDWQAANCECRFAPSRYEPRR